MTAAPASEADELIQWQRDGIIGPFQAMAADDIEAIRREFESQSGDGSAQRTMNRHCDLPMLGELCRNAFPARRLQSLLGPDLVLWRSNLFLGNPRLDWHEDRHARLLGDGFAISALLAMVDGDADNCTLVVPGSHRLDAAEKEIRYGITADPQAGGNIRYRGSVSDSDFVRLPLAAGQCFIFHPGLLHASSGMLGGETPTRPRASIVFRVTTPDVPISPAAYESDPTRTGPVMISGVDAFGINRYVALA